MLEVEVIKAGLHTTVQDSGRSGHRSSAIPMGGYLHRGYAEEAGLALGLPEGSAMLECLMTAPTLLFREATSVVVTGADFQFMINDTPIKCGVVYQVDQGDVLAGGSAADGWIGYIGILGQLVGSQDYGSMSSYGTAGLGYNNGLPLRRCHKLCYQSQDASTTLASFSYSPTDTTDVVFMRSGPDDHLLSLAELSQLINTTFTVSPRSNRMGLRLEPVQAAVHHIKLQHSVPAYPGFVQLTPDGTLIVAAADSHSTGGYPRIGYLADVQLMKLLALPLGSRVKCMLLE